jgi:hypothetical protein
MDDKCFIVVRLTKPVPAAVNKSRYVELQYVNEWEVKDTRKPSWEPPVHVAYTMQEAYDICKLMNATV